MLDWDKILKENKEKVKEQQKKKLNKNRDKTKIDLQENYKEATERLKHHAQKNEYGRKVSSAGYDAKELDTKD